MGAKGSGPVGREMAALGVRYGAALRALVAGASTLVSFGLATAREPWPAALVMSGLTLWSLGYAVFLLRGNRAATAADILLVCAVCLTQPWTNGVGAQQDSTSWTLVVASIVVVTYQWHLGMAYGAAAAVMVVGAYLVGAVSLTAAAPLGLWMLVEAVLSRALFSLLTSGALAADEAAASAARTRHAAALAQARREDEREHLAAIHDTASATMLMVGLGVVHRREVWLSAQAVRDREIILGRAQASDQEVNLVTALHTAADGLPLRVRWQTVHSAPVPIRVASAISYGAREALTNVLRHAGVNVAVVRLEIRDGTTRVEITDTGKGFDPHAVPSGRYGLAWSIKERMVRAGGRADITSTPGRGTRIRLEWPDALC